MAGELWTWGQGGYAHGTGVLTDVLSPQQLGSKAWARAVSGEEHVAFAIDDAGALYAWGRGDWYALGFNNGQLVTTPTLLNAGPWVDVSCNPVDPYGMLAVKADGTLWTVGGDSGNGELGRGGSSAVVLTQVGAATDWAKVRVSYASTLALKADGTLWSWGYGGYGTLATGGTASRSTPGQAGVDADWADIFIVNSAAALGLKQNGALYYWGRAGDFTPDPPGGGSNVLSPYQIAGSWLHAAGGQSHGLAIKADGTLWSWGENLQGELGDGTTTAHAALAQVGSDSDWAKAFASGHDYSFAIKDDGTLWSWGDGADGTLGLGDVADRLTPVQVGTDNDWSHIDAGFRTVFAIKGAPPPPPVVPAFWDAFRKSYEVR